MAVYRETPSINLKIIELFRKCGYSVSTNKMFYTKTYPIIIDILAQYEAPLHSSDILIKIITPKQDETSEKFNLSATSGNNNLNNVDYDVFQKFIKNLDQLSFSKAILITPSSFSSTVKQNIPQNKNIELWDGEFLKTIFDKNDIVVKSNLGKTSSVSNVKSMFVTNVLSKDEIIKHIHKTTGEKLKELLHKNNNIIKNLKIDLVYYPYYDVEIESKIRDRKKNRFTGKKTFVTFTKTSKISIDARNQHIITCSKSGIKYYYTFLNYLSTEEKSILEVFDTSSFTKKEIEMVFGISSYKVTKIILNLLSINAIKIIDVRPETYQTTYSFPTDPEILESISDFFDVTETNEAQASMPINVDRNSISSFLKRIWQCDIKNIQLIQYPYYKISYLDNSDQMMSAVFDGVSGKVQNAL